MLILGINSDLLMHNVCVGSGEFSFLVNFPVSLMHMVGNPHLEKHLFIWTPLNSHVGQFHRGAQE